MRVLTYILIVASVLLSSGGVAIRSAADSASTDEVAGTCAVPAPVRVRTIQVSPVREPGKAINLNARGYNYRRGEDATSGAPAPVPPAAPKGD